MAWELIRSLAAAERHTVWHRYTLSPTRWLSVRQEAPGVWRWSHHTRSGRGGGGRRLAEGTATSWAAARSAALWAADRDVRTCTSCAGECLPDPDGFTCSSCGDEWTRDHDPILYGELV